MSSVRLIFFSEEKWGINIGGAGVITIDGRKYDVAFKEGMCIGMGAQDITFHIFWQADDPSPFPALSQIEVYGRNRHGTP